MAYKKKTAQKKDTPVTYRGSAVQPNDMKSFMAEWSLSQAEANHVETIEEANDFDIQDEEDEDFLQNFTVYEMHEIAEDNLAIYNQEQADDPPESVDVESNETSDRARDPQNSHVQSAPIEQTRVEQTD